MRSYARHLEIVWDDGLTLHTNQWLTGSWRLYRVGEQWHKPTRQLRVLIEVADWVGVCFNAPVVETFRQFDRHRHPGLGGLGPDLSHANADLDECFERILDHVDQRMPIAEVLLDQYVASGIGNVYRCEVLWAVGLSPFATAGSISEKDARDVVQTAARLLRANLVEDRGFTVAGVGGGVAVYGRNGQRCERCGNTIQVKRIGEMNRLLYWCPGCQARGDQRIAPTPPKGVERPMDPHPAAALFLSELPWRRSTDWSDQPDQSDQFDQFDRPDHRGPHARPA